MGVTVVILADGSSHGNPGPSAVGAALWFRGKGKSAGRPPDEVVAEKIGIATSNQAEHIAIQFGLELAWQHGAEEVYLFSDSQLAVNHVNETWAVNDLALQALVETTQKMMKQENWKITVAWVPRELTGRADKLADAALEEPASREGSLLEQCRAREEM